MMKLGIKESHSMTGSQRWEGKRDGLDGVFLAHRKPWSLMEARMSIRTRSVKGLLSGLIAATIILVLCVVLAFILKVSLATNSSNLQEYVNNPIISGLIAAFIPATFLFLFSLCKGFRVPWISFNDHRTIISRSELNQQFETDGTVTLLVEDGFCVKANNAARRSRIVYKNEVTDRFTFFAEFYPFREKSRAAYWRAGLSLRRTTGTLDDNEVICVHLDNQNLIIGYLDRKVAMSAAVPTQIHDRWSRLGISTSIDPTSNMMTVYAHFDDLSYLLGVISFESLLKASIEIWSDEHRSHHVLVRDISFTTRQA
jgi:hypothetical protein